MARREVGTVWRIHKDEICLLAGRRAIDHRAGTLHPFGQLGAEPLIALLKDENPYVRSFAAEGLGELGDKRAVQRLIEVLKDEDEQVRQSATQALRKLGFQPSTDVQ